MHLAFVYTSQEILTGNLTNSITYTILLNNTISVISNTNSCNSSGLHFKKLTLGLLQHKIDRGVLNPDKITMFDLVSQNIVNIPFDYTGIQLDIQVCFICYNCLSLHVSFSLYISLTRIIHWINNRNIEPQLISEIMITRDFY